MSKQNKTGFFVQSGSVVAASTLKRTPIIVINYDGPLPAQLTLAGAAALALNILQAVEASAQDTFLIDFLHTRVGAADHEIREIIAEYREWRAKDEGA